MHTIAPAEWFWLAVNGSTTVLTIYALADARADARAVKALNGRAREIAAFATVRQEAVRLVTQVLLLALVVPGLFVDQPITLTPWLVVLMSVPVLLLVNSIGDARDRKALANQVIRDAYLGMRRTGDVE